MRLPFAAGALGLALLSSAASAQTAGGAASPIDRQFVGNASASNTFEIRSSQMALRKSHDAGVRDMARWMIDSHTVAAHKLQAVAGYDEYQGSAAPVVTPMTEGMLTDLAALDGAEFDKAYIADQIAAHRMTSQQMSDYAAQGSSDPLLRYDAVTLPEVNLHLAHFEALSRDM